MQRCLDLARNGLGSVAPNPMVGSVIVHQRKIIGGGWHRNYGEAHAEVNAIHSVKDKSLLSESTIYVSLEPCAHFGKTPPCADLIVKHHIPKVVIGCKDIFAKVNGQGIERLKDSGAQVKVGVLEKECLDLNKRFFTFHSKKRPFIILKWAQSKDGFLDKGRSDMDTGPNWITGKEAQILVHKWRSEEDAILVGTRTALIDNPSLTTRKYHGKNPTRFVIDKDLKIPYEANLFDESVPTVVFTQKDQIKSKNLKFQALNFDDTLIDQILNYAYQQSIQSIIIEGGADVLNQFIQSNQWDEARVFIGEPDFNKGLPAPKISIAPVSRLSIGQDQLLNYVNS